MRQRMEQGVIVCLLAAHEAELLSGSSSVGSTCRRAPRWERFKRVQDGPGQAVWKQDFGPFQSVTSRSEARRSFNLS